jgi:hypothetical protein
MVEDCLSWVLISKDNGTFGSGKVRFAVIHKDVHIPELLTAELHYLIPVSHYLIASFIIHRSGRGGFLPGFSGAVFPRFCP